MSVTFQLSYDAIIVFAILRDDLNALWFNGLEFECSKICLLEFECLDLTNALLSEESC